MQVKGQNLLQYKGQTICSKGTTDTRPRSIQKAKPFWMLQVNPPVPKELEHMIIPTSKIFFIYGETTPHTPKIKFRLRN